jgi:elongation factor 1 alpha-like protein
MSIAAMFNDMPWGNIPQDRVTVFIEPQRPRGGLLGGSGTAPKLTKLQQLALARKKKAEEQQSSEEQAEDARQRLGELSVREAQSLKANRASDGGGFIKRQKLSDTNAAGRMQAPESVSAVGDKTPISAKSTSRTSRSANEKTANTEESPAPETATPSSSTGTEFGSAPNEVTPAPEMAQPSTFAQTLFGAASVEPKPPATKFFALPYMAFCPSLADAFSKPSPDDVVLAAQAKGSIKGMDKN